MNIMENSLEAKYVDQHLHSYSNPLRLAETGPIVIERG